MFSVHLFYLIIPTSPELKQGILTEGEGSVRLTSWVLTSLDLLLFTFKIYVLYKTSYLNEEVNCTEPFPLVRVPWSKLMLTFYPPPP
jgi:hypothetical protein